VTYIRCKMALTPLTLAEFTALALADTAKLCDRHCVIEIGDRAKHLAHQLGRGHVIDEELGLSAAIRSMPRSRNLAWAQRGSATLPNHCRRRSRCLLGSAQGGHRLCFY
jgi:hypothetical protein